MDPQIEAIKAELLAEVSHALVSSGLPPKPKFGSSCNYCGLCCSVSPCDVAKKIYADNWSAPCPSLVMEGGKALCGLVSEAPEATANSIKTILGMGYGCSMPDQDTTQEDLNAFDIRSLMKLLRDPDALMEAVRYENQHSTGFEEETPAGL